MNVQQSASPGKLAYKVKRAVKCGGNTPLDLQGSP